MKCEVWTVELTVQSVECGVGSAEQGCKVLSAECKV